jgi:uncharacterized membrane protein
VKKLLAALLATTLTMMVLDLVFLGIIAKGFYDSALGPLKRPDVYWPAALLFYAMYVGATVLYAERGASSMAVAAQRGASLGLVAYGTYELTNWAVLRGWPTSLVAVDLVWGVVLTATAAAAGFAAMSRVP